MNHLKLILTFDYELPLGGIVKSYRHSLFDPTDRLMELLEKLKVPAVFFADILSYIKFGEWNETGFAQAFKNQMQQAIYKGHDVQLHLHPHWLESTFTNGNVAPSPKYKMGDFANEDNHYNIETIVELGVNELTKIGSSANPEYRCMAFRAGGYNFVPHADKILNALFKHGIRFDSSISPGYFFRSNTSLVDYRNVPNLPNWYLSSDGDFSKTDVNKNTLFEIPIASKPKGIFEMPTSFKLKKYADRAVESRGPMIHSNESVGKRDKVRQLFSNRMLTVDNHTFSPGYLMKILDYNVNRYNHHNEIILSLIGHPKSMDKYRYFLLSEFVRLASKKYGPKLEFVTFTNLNKNLSTT